MVRIKLCDSPYDFAHNDCKKWALQIQKVRFFGLILYWQTIDSSNSYEELSEKEERLMYGK